MTLRFGTDGVRGEAGSEVTPELALALGRASVRVLAPAGAGAGTPRVVVGRDTRRSGPMLAAAVTAGAAAEGAEVVDLGVVPTPTVAWASAHLGVPGVVVSASHNPYADNGLKLFAPGGRKLSTAEERAVEAVLDGDAPACVAPTGAAVGGPAPAGPAAEVRDGWARSVLAPVHGGRLRGLRVVVDAGHGAAAAFAADLLGGGGADVVGRLGVAPDGTNINDACGATHTEALRRAVVGAGADAGVALDGDADRCVMVDATGAEVDGDHLIALLAVDRHARGALPGDAVAVTVMANLGFHRAMAAHGIGVVTTAVGDRHVLEALEAGGLALGGEQSGHIIQRDLATTGDGLLSALTVLEVVARTGRPLAELAGVVTRLPQVLRNVRVASGGHRPVELVAAVADEVGAVEAALGDTGRVLLRPSGTEPLVRVMVEAPTAAEAEALADRLVGAVTAAAAG